MRSADTWRLPQHGLLPVRIIEPGLVPTRLFQAGVVGFSVRQIVICYRPRGRFPVFVVPRLMLRP
jgi:hypothetical protein